MLLYVQVEHITPQYARYLIFHMYVKFKGNVNFNVGILTYRTNKYNI